MKHVTDIEISSKKSSPPKKGFYIIVFDWLFPCDCTDDVSEYI